MSAGSPPSPSSPSGESRSSGRVDADFFPGTFFNFGGSGGAAFAYGPTGATIEGNTGAFSRVDVNVTGPSGASSDRVTGFSADTNIFIRGTSADGPSGAPYINELGATI